MKDIIEIVIGFNTNNEEIQYIKSDFMNKNSGFKDPVDYTAKLIAMALEHWIREEIGVYCPDCDLEMEKGWTYCPGCGWSHEK